MRIDAISPLNVDATQVARSEAKESSALSFTDILGEAREAEKSADNMAARFADGDPEIGIHEVMIASEKAAISVRYATTLKNRILESYRELMNTPV